jgi:curved DNA-binding protein CbpA
VTHYDVLGVERAATAEQIRRAYYEAARRHHPDMHAGSSDDVLAEARRAMASVNAAWEVLGDPARRRVYDESLGTVREPEPRGTEAPPAWVGEPDVDDTPVGLRAQSVVMLPVGLLAAAGGSFAFGMMSQIAAFLVIAFLLASLAGFGFVAAPLLTMRRRTARDRDPGPRS